ncbi:ParA family protein, partial (plasmid) [Borreliella garinii]
MDRENTKIITIGSIKGGVGKSTSAIIFATLLSKKY